MKKDRGQFIILAAIALITTILVIAATATSSGLRIRSSQELSTSIPLLNAIDDSRRALTVALSYASWIFNASGYDRALANNTSHTYLLGWTNNFSELHGGRGINTYISSRVDFQWWSNGTVWWSNSSGLLIVNAFSSGVPELKADLVVGVILSNLSIVDNLGFNITALDAYRNVGISIRLVSLKVDNATVSSWSYQYFGSGLNGFYNNTITSTSILEAYFEYNGILVRVYRIP